MSPTPNGSPTWKIIAVATVAALFALLGYLAKDVRTEIQTLKDTKVDKTQYQSDIRELKSMVRCIYNWHVPEKYRVPQDGGIFIGDKGEK